MQFEFLSTPRIYFGSKQFQNIGSLVKEFGSRLLVVASSSALEKSPKTKETLNLLASEHNFKFDTYIIKGEPTIETIDFGVKKDEEFKAEVVMGLGGGSAIDACKAIAASAFLLMRGNLF